MGDKKNSDLYMKINKYVEYYQYEQKISLWSFFLSQDALIGLVFFAGNVFYLYYYLQLEYLKCCGYEFNVINVLSLEGVIIFYIVFTKYKKSLHRKKNKLSLEENKTKSIFLYRLLMVLRIKAKKKF